MGVCSLADARDSLLSSTSGAPALHAISADDDVPVREAIAAQLDILKADDASLGEREDAALELMTLGLQGPQALAKFASREADRIERGIPKAKKRVFKAFDKRAQAVVTKRLNGKTQREVDELQKTIVRHARDSNLAKETIVNVSDPALARLRELLTVKASDVFDVDEKLFERWSDLLDDVDEMALCRRWLGEALDAMVDVPGGAAAADRFDRPAGEAAATSASLMAELERMVELARAMTAADRRVFANNEAMALDPDNALPADEAYGVRDLNLLRVLIGLPALRLDTKLCNASRGHSSDMVEHGFFAHDSPVPKKETPSKRAALAGTSGGAENIYMGSPEPVQANKAWWHSPGHHRNMLGDHSTTGMGRHDSHWTQMFG